MLLDIKYLTMNNDMSEKAAWAESGLHVHDRMKIISRRHLPKKKCSIDHAQSVAAAGDDPAVVQQPLDEIEALSQDVLSQTRTCHVALGTSTEYDVR